MLESLYNDISNSKERTFEKQDEGYRFDVAANYPNNSNLVKQSILLDKNLQPISVDVYNDNNNLQMSIKFNNIEINKNIEQEIFDLNNIIGNLENKQDEISDDGENGGVVSIDDIIYPLYIPTGTVLTEEEKVAKTDGERIILTFDGEKPFTLVEETVSIGDKFSVIPMSGDLYLLPSTIATLSENSINWVSDGIEYYLASDVMSQIELVEIANSVTRISSGK